MKSCNINQFSIVLIIAGMLSFSASAGQYRLASTDNIQDWNTASWQILHNGYWETTAIPPGSDDDVLVDEYNGRTDFVLRITDKIRIHGLSIGLSSAVRLELRSAQPFRMTGDLFLGTRSTLCIPSDRNTSGVQTGLLILEGSLRLEHGAVIDAGPSVQGLASMVLESAAPAVQTVSMPTVAINPFPLPNSGTARLGSKVLLDIVDATPDFAHASEALVLTGDLLSDGVIRMSGRSLDLGAYNLWLGSNGRLESDDFNRFGAFSSAVFVPSSDRYHPSAHAASPLQDPGFTGTVRKEIPSLEDDVTLPLAAGPLFSLCPITLKPRDGNLVSGAYVAIRLVASSHPLAADGVERFWILLSEGISGGVFDVQARMDRRATGMRASRWDYLDQHWHNGDALSADGQTLTLSGCAAQADITARPEQATSVDAMPNRSMALEPAFPNPFRDASLLRFSLERPQTVCLNVTDASGRIVASLLRDVRLDAGNHNIRFLPSDLPSGVYYAILSGGDAIATRKLVLTH